MNPKRRFDQKNTHGLLWSVSLMFLSLKYFCWAGTGNAATSAWIQTAIILLLCVYPYSAIHKKFNWTCSSTPMWYNCSVIHFLSAHCRAVQFIVWERISIFAKICGFQFMSKIRSVHDFVLQVKWLLYLLYVSLKVSFLENCCCSYVNLLACLCFSNSQKSHLICDFVKITKWECLLKK